MSVENNSVLWSSGAVCGDVHTGNTTATTTTHKLIDEMTLSRLTAASSDLVDGPSKSSSHRLTDATATAASTHTNTFPAERWSALSTALCTPYQIKSNQIYLLKQTYHIYTWVVKSVYERGQQG